MLGSRDLGRIDTGELGSQALSRVCYLFAGVRTRGRAHGLWGEERSGPWESRLRDWLRAEALWVFQTWVFSAGTSVAKLMEGLGAEGGKDPRTASAEERGVTQRRPRLPRGRPALCSRLLRGSGSRSHPCQRLQGRTWGDAVVHRAGRSWEGRHLGTMTWEAGAAPSPGSSCAVTVRSEALAPPGTAPCFTAATPEAGASWVDCLPRELQ